jgi:uncharacterized Rmd1/YagE family protein
MRVQAKVVVPDPPQETVEMDICGDKVNDTNVVEVDVVMTVVVTLCIVIVVVTVRFVVNPL